MESKLISNNSLVQTTDVEEFNKFSTMFSKKPRGFISFRDFFVRVDINPTLTVTIENSPFLQQKGKFHLRNDVSASDLNSVLKNYD